MDKTYLYNNKWFWKKSKNVRAISKKTNKITVEKPRENLNDFLTSNHFLFDPNLDILLQRRRLQIEIEIFPCHFVSCYNVVEL